MRGRQKGWTRFSPRNYSHRGICPLTHSRRPGGGSGAPADQIPSHQGSPVQTVDLGRAVSRFLAWPVMLYVVLPLQLASRLLCGLGRRHVHASAALSRRVSRPPRMRRGWHMVPVPHARVASPRQGLRCKL